MNNRIKYYREQKGLTLLELANLCNISTGYLSHLENGSRKNPSFNVMSKIANVLNKKITDIFLN